MAKKRTGLRMHPVVGFLASVLMRQRGFATFTALIEQLIRDDWDERVTPQMQAELTAMLEKEKSSVALNEPRVSYGKPAHKPNSKGARDAGSAAKRVFAKEPPEPPKRRH